MIDDQQFAELAEYLLTFTENTVWNGWQIEQVLGGYNNLLFRVEKLDAVFAVKLTTRDERRRGWRERNALLAMAQAGLAIAPRLIWFDEVVRQPTVVQSWVDGAVSAEPPNPTRLAHFFTQLHSIEAAQIEIDYPAILSPRSAVDMFDFIEGQLALIGEISAELNALLMQARAINWPQWAPPPLTLIHADNNPMNFVDLGDRLIGIDWEYAGLGDAAFDSAEMRAAPKLWQTDAAYWQTFLDAYPLSADPDFKLRYDTYHTLMLVWWGARLERARWERTHKITHTNPRLATLDPNWEQQNRLLREHYVGAATVALTVF